MADVANEWLERLAIQDVIYRYSDALTRADWDVFESLWMPDAIWEVGGSVGLEFQGSAEIRRLVTQSHEAGARLVQMASGAVVTLQSAERASARTMVHVVETHGGGVSMYGVYHDDLVRDDGSWRFTRRRLEVFYSEPTQPSGKWS